MNRLLGLVFLYLTASIGLSAHEGRPLYIEVTEQSAGHFGLKWRIPPVLAHSDLPTIAITGLNCTATQPSFPAPAGWLLYQCPSRPAAISITYPYANPVLSALVRYHWLDGDTGTILAGPDQQQINLPVKTTLSTTVSSYSITGIDHILSGIDHLLFVACLFWIAWSGGAKPLKRLILAVTGFTVGHSITLAWVTLGGLEPPSRLVETLIAFSILVMALEIARGNGGSAIYRAPVLVSALFGLLHGLGFAGALADIGLPYNQELVALAFFNIGVEIGQLVFVAGLLVAMFGCRFLVTQLRNSDPIASFVNIGRFIFSRGVGSLSAYWMISRFLAI